MKPNVSFLEYSENVQLLANSAQLLANSAQLLGNSAQLLGNSAQLLANSAQLLANSAQLLANSAQLLANSAQLLANSAQLLANSAQLLANSAQLDSIAQAQVCVYCTDFVYFTELSNRLVAALYRKVWNLLAVMDLLYASIAWGGEGEVDGFNRHVCTRSLKMNFTVLNSYLVFVKNSRHAGRVLGVKLC